MKTAVIKIATEKQRPTFSSLISNPPGQLDRLPFFHHSQVASINNKQNFYSLWFFCIFVGERWIKRRDVDGYTNQ